MRKIHIVTAGKHDDRIESLINDYTKRLHQTFTVVWHITKTSDMQSENKYFTKQLADKKYVALDERGEDVSSKSISSYLSETALNGNGDLYFLIGGAYGINSELLKRATRVWKFGNITLPHQLARLLLVEQIYRGHSIIVGAKYHHD